MNAFEDKKPIMNCLIISGMSGAGKSLTVDVLEDIGYYCVDNMPAALIPRFVELFARSPSKYKRVAFVVDVRGDSDFDRLFSDLDEMRKSGVQCSVLFLDCSDAVLVSRQKESRRRHPLDQEGSGIAAAFAEEREMLSPIRKQADYIIDTTALTSAGLKTHLINMFGGEGGRKFIVVSLITFGFKYGIPLEADMLFDVRFLKNPYYIPELREKNGMDREVYDYVFKNESAGKFMGQVTEMLDFLIPQYLAEGKTSLVVALGCTGGRHRSVAMGERLHAELKEKGHNVIIRHRDYMRN